MSDVIQAVVAYSLVLLSGAYLLRRWWHGRRQQTCDRCGPASRPLPAPPHRGVRPRSLRVLR